jgi:hypothetical protein
MILMMNFMTQIRWLASRIPACLASFLLFGSAVLGQGDPDPSFRIELGESHDRWLGGESEVDVFLHAADPGIEFGSFDFTFAYHGAALIFQKATAGELMTECGWEYFAYAHEPAGEWATMDPISLVRVVGVADIAGSSGGSYVPNCPDPSELPKTLLRLAFRVAANCDYECVAYPVRFYWTECFDNTIQSRDGTALYLSRRVFDQRFAGEPLAETEITGDGNQSFPSYIGAHDNCLLEFDPESVVRGIDFGNGFVDLICADTLCVVNYWGDINQNQITPEVADLIMFRNYFLEGLAAFGAHVEHSVTVSDVNRDGITLSVADLQALARVTVGFGSPDYGQWKSVPVTATLTHRRGELSVDRKMAAAFIVVSGRQTPRLTADVEMQYGFDGDNTRILVFDPSATATFVGEFLRVGGTLISAEFAGLTGETVELKVVPSSFMLGQNYPNPFNPMTAIDFVIPGGGAWKLDIFNIAGQKVQTFSGVLESDSGRIEWDATDLPTGVYYYRLRAGQNSVARKAVLLK